MEKPWIKERWYVSNYNFHPEVKEKIDFQTLRSAIARLREVNSSREWSSLGRRRSVLQRHSMGLESIKSKQNACRLP